MNKVYILHHVHEMPNGEEDVKLIGVYDSKRRAEDAINRLKMLPGFKNTVDGFVIGEYTINEDHWANGFSTWTPSGG